MPLDCGQIGEPISIPLKSLFLKNGLARKFLSFSLPNFHKTFMLYSRLYFLKEPGLPELWEDGREAVEDAT